MQRRTWEFAGGLQGFKIGALRIRIGFLGGVYYNKEPPKIV